MKKLLLASALALPLMTSPAFADHHGERKKGKMFEAADTNGDGTLSESEFKDHQMKKADEWFEKIDVNSDGNVTPEEAKEGRKELREKMKDRREKRKEKRDSAE